MKVSNGAPDSTLPTDLDLLDLALLFDALPVEPVSCPSGNLCALLHETDIHNHFIDAIRHAQDQDPELLGIKVALRNADIQPPERMLYQLQDDLLVVAEADGRVRIVVPTTTLQQDVCRYFHDEGGHQGLHRTINSITHNFYWPNLQKHIRAYVTSCRVCQAAKPATRAPAGQSEPHRLPSEPGAHWTLDFVELPTSADGHTCLLVATDRLSKLVILSPMKDITALAVAQVLIDELYCWFGMPISILTDRGAQFQSAVFHEICTLLGMSIRHSTPQ